MTRAGYVVPAVRIAAWKPKESPLATFGDDGHLIRTARDMSRLALLLAMAPDKETECILQPVGLAELEKRCPRTFDFWLADLRTVLSRASRDTEKKEGATPTKIRSEVRENVNGAPLVVLWIERRPKLPPSLVLELELAP